MRLNIANVKYVASLNYFNRLFSSAAGDDGEPEHLHDPPFLKHIPHLWPGGGVGNDDYDEDAITTMMTMVATMAMTTMIILI